MSGVSFRNEMSDFLDCNDRSRHHPGGALTGPVYLNVPAMFRRHRQSGARATRATSSRPTPRSVSCPCDGRGSAAVVILTTRLTYGVLGRECRPYVVRTPNCIACRPATFRLLLRTCGSSLRMPELASRYANLDGGDVVCNRSELRKGSSTLAGAAHHRGGEISCRVHIRDLAAGVALEVQVVAPATDQFHFLLLPVLDGPLLPRCVTWWRQMRQSS